MLNCVSKAFTLRETEKKSIASQVHASHLYKIDVEPSRPTLDQAGTGEALDLDRCIQKAWVTYPVKK